MLNSNISWQSFPTSINSLSDFTNYIDSLVATNGSRVGYIGATTAPKIGLESNGNGYYIVILSNSANYKIVIATSAINNTLYSIRKTNQVWQSAWFINPMMCSQRIESTDVETLTTYGTYQCIRCTNTPNDYTGWVTIEVLPYGGNNSNYVLQIAHMLNNLDTYYKLKNNGTWGSWTKAPTRAEVDALNSRTQWYYVRQTSSAVNVSISFSKYQTTSIVSCVCSSGQWGGVWLYSNGYLLPIKIVGDNLSATLSSNYTTITISKTEGFTSSTTISLLNTLDIPSVTDIAN